MCSLATERRECRRIFDFDVGTTTAATLAFTTTTTGVSAPAATSATSAASGAQAQPLPVQPQPSPIAATGAPILFLGSGEHFDDFEPFVARSFVSRLLGMGDMSTLVKQIKDTIGDDKNDEMMEKFSKGEFTLRDMYEQFENVMKLGPLSKVMAMIPGIPQMGGEGDEGMLPVRPNRLPSDIPDFNYLRFTEKHDEIVAATELCDADELTRLRAYLDVECAAANHFAGRRFRALAFWARSLLAVPRLSLHLSPAWETDTETPQRFVSGPKTS